MNAAPNIISPLEINEIKISVEDRIQQTAKSLVVHDEKLNIEGTILHYSSIVEGQKLTHDCNLEDFWLPGVAGWEHPVPLLIYPHLTTSLIATLDNFSGRCGNTIHFPKKYGPAFATTIGRFMEWNLINGRYRLELIENKDIADLEKQLAKGGMIDILDINNRLNKFINYLDTSPDMLNSFLTFNGNESTGIVQGISTSLLAKCIGSYNLNNMISKDFYKQIGDRAIAAGYRLEEIYHNKGRAQSQKPGTSTLNQYFSCWNELARLYEYDRLTFLPFPNVWAKANELGEAPSRTANIHVEDVVTLLGDAHHWLFNVSPILVKIVAELRELKDKPKSMGTYANNRTIKELWFPNFLSTSKLVDKLEEVAGVKLYREGSPDKCTNSKDKDSWSLVDCITAVMTACYLVLQIYNARRQAEIQDPIIGVKAEYFRCKSKKYNWYQNFFFNEKHGKRLWYTLNKGSTKAMQVLIQLSKAWDEHGYNGLFNVPSFSLDENRHFQCYQYRYSGTGKQRINGNKFLELSLGKTTQDIGASHVFRRIYAIIYHYQYENSDLLSLCHQLGHIDPDDTLVYVTEPTSRDLHEQLHYKVKLSKNEERENTLAINEDNAALQRIIDEVDLEKTAEDILEIMLGNAQMGGRYTAFLRRIFRILDKNLTFRNENEQQINFSELPPEAKSKKMAEVMFNKGHRNKPKPRGSCHRIPNTKRNHDGPCEPESCKRCSFQEVKDIHLSIMEQDLIDLKVIQDDLSQPLTERIQAEQSITNLQYVINAHRNTMSRNHQLFIRR